MNKIKKETLQGWGVLVTFAVVFIVLKLTGLTTWGWVWVLSPIWLPFVFALVAVLAMVPMLVIQGIRDALKGDQNGRS